MYDHWNSNCGFQNNNCWLGDWFLRDVHTHYTGCVTQTETSVGLHSIATDIFQCGRLLLWWRLLWCVVVLKIQEALHLYFKHKCWDFYQTHLTEPATVSIIVMTKDQSAARKHSGQKWWTVVEKSFWTPLAFALTVQFISVQTKNKVQGISIHLSSSDTAKHFKRHTQFIDKYFVRMIRIRTSPRASLCVHSLAKYWLPHSDKWMVQRSITFSRKQ